MANFQDYINTELRKEAISIRNDATLNPKTDDAGNWTGCQINKGELIGTYRDISACLYSQILGRPTTKKELQSITEKEAEQIIKTYFWDKLKLDRIPDQETANICIHIFLHYGNVKIIQKALNKLGAKLVTDGIAGIKTNTALLNYTANNSIQTYNIIREELKINYEIANHVYRNTFLETLEKHFPPKEENFYFYGFDNGENIYIFLDPEQESKIKNKKICIVYDSTQKYI